MVTKEQVDPRRSYGITGAQVEAETRLYHSCNQVLKETIEAKKSMDQLNIISPMPIGVNSVNSTKIGDGGSAAKVHYQNQPFSISTNQPASRVYISAISSMASLAV